jgi:hypothetical protein
MKRHSSVKEKPRWGTSGTDPYMPVQIANQLSRTEWPKPERPYESFSLY